MFDFNSGARAERKERYGPTRMVYKFNKNVKIATEMSRRET